MPCARIIIGCNERCGMYSRMRARAALSMPTIIMGGTTPSRIRRSPVSSTCHSIPLKEVAPSNRFCPSFRYRTG